MTIAERLKNARKLTYENLKFTHNGKKTLTKTNLVITCVILLAVVTTILETEVTIRERAPDLFIGLNLFFIIVFSIEYIVRLWAQGEDPKYAGFTGRIRFIFSFWSIIDLLAIIPFILSFGHSDTLLLRLFRIFRLLTLTKLGKYSDSLKNITNALVIRRNELIISVGATLYIMLISSIFLYLAEGKNNPEEFGSIPRAFWWGAATVTKLGYGGAYPETVLGKLFSVIFGICAVLIIAVPTGIIAGSFYEAFAKKRKDKKERKEDPKDKKQG